MTAKQSGPGIWPKDNNDAKLSAMVEEIGVPLLDIAAWAGCRAAEGDRESLDLLAKHVIEIVRITEKLSKGQKDLVSL